MKRHSVKVLPQGSMANKRFFVFLLYSLYCLLCTNLFDNTNNVLWYSILGILGYQKAVWLIRLPPINSIQMALW